MVKMQCSKCNYIFNKDKIPARCPYCAAENSVRRQVTANDILNEVIREEKVIEDSRKERG